MSDSLRPHGLYSPWNSLGQNTGVGSLFLLQGIFPTQESNPMQVSCIVGGSLPGEPQGKPKNTGVGRLPHLWWILPTQELNRGLLHCRQILYQLSFQRSPIYKVHNRCINKEIEIRCTINVCTWIIPKPSPNPCHGKLSSTILVPGDKKTGNHWLEN